MALIFDAYFDEPWPDRDPERSGRGFEWSNELAEGDGRFGVMVADLNRLPEDYARAVQSVIDDFAHFERIGILSSSRIAGLRVLDWEAGNGSHALAMLALGASEVVAIDSWVDPDGLPEAVRSFPGLRFLKTSIEDFERVEPGAGFDLVFANTVSEHIQDLASAFDCILRLLKKDGYFFNNHDNYYSPCGHHDHGFWFYGRENRVEFMGERCWEHDEKCERSAQHRRWMSDAMPWCWPEHNNNELTPENCTMCRYYHRSQEWAHLRAATNFPWVFNDPSFTSFRAQSSLNKFVPIQIVQLLSEAGFRIDLVHRDTLANQPDQDVLRTGISALDLTTSMVRILCSPMR